jgi:hypothetical protein
MTASPFDVAVLGAGAAGILAATRAAERGRRAVLLEKNRRPGVKILISGGTRCNVTHDCDARGIVEAFGENGAFLRPALAAFPPDALRKLLENEGVALYVEPENGKVFPRSDRAQDVLAALLRRLDRSGARLECGAAVREVERAGKCFRVSTAAGVFEADKVVLTTGGVSFPKTGTTGDGYRIAAALGHEIVPPRPALVPLASNDPEIRALSGIALQDAAVRVRSNGRVLAERRAPLLFTHTGLSGPAAMDVSRAVSTAAAITLEIDLLPASSPSDLDAWLRSEASSGGRRLVATVLDTRTPRRLAEAALAAARVPADRKLSELSRAERAAVVRALKALPAPISGTLGFDKAEVTAGGVALDGVNPKTMESRLVPRFFLAGEVLDLDAWIGGYNFQGAFSTGWLAGSSV